MWGGMFSTICKFLGVITNFYTVNRWLSVRFNLVSAVVVGVTGFVVVTAPSIDASLAGVALTFAMSVTGDVSPNRL
jgi:hypothetical protein